MRVVVALACVALAEPLAAQIYAIHAGAVIDPARGTVDRGQTVVVTDGRITAMGPQVAAPAGATPIDLSKEWLMPGLMDAHTHLTLTEVVGGSAAVDVRAELATRLAIRIAAKRVTIFKSIRGTSKANVCH